MCGCRNLTLALATFTLAICTAMSISANDSVPGSNNRVPSLLGERPGIPVEVVDVVHERGNLEFNGVDSVLLNWSTLVDPERNKGATCIS
jgi:hypothetical protein